MKFSIFNFFFELNNQIYLFNSFSEAFLKVKSDKILWNDLSEKERSIYYKNGIFVDDSINEFDRLNLRLENLKNIPIFNLSINVTNSCNLKCSYCYNKNNNPNKSKVIEEKIIDSILQRVMKVLEKEKIEKLNVVVSGGEPFVCYDKIRYFVKRITRLNLQLDSSVLIITNGTLIKKNDILELFMLGVKNYQLTLDGNKIYHDNIRRTNKGIGTYNKIIENIKIIYEITKTPITLRINVSRENYLLINDLLDDLNRNVINDSIILSFARVYNEDLDFYYNELPRIIYKCYKLAFDRGFKSTYNWKSNIVKNKVCMQEINRSIIINQDGNLYRCPYLLDDKYKVEKDLDVIKEKKINTTLINNSCLECEMLGICNGGCRYQKEENYNKSSKYYCDKKMFIEALKIHTLIIKD